MSRTSTTRRRRLAAGLGGVGLAASLAAAAPPPNGLNAGNDAPFRRIASFPVFLNTDVDLRTVAEIVTASTDGNLLIYTDSATGNLGFVDITDPADPQADGVIALGGEPTSVAVKGGHALAVVNTSADFVNTSGQLQVIDIAARQVVRTIELGGQPDAIAVSPNGRFAAICIENERDEDFGDGSPPQFPPGFVVIVDLVGAPAGWTTRTVDLVGVPALFPEDPEPEYVDIGQNNVAAVTLQENNEIVLIRLGNGQIVGSYSAGSADLEGIDTNENDLIEQTTALAAIPREPDAIAWTSGLTFATADEGDLDGGSRGFTVWHRDGVPLFEAGNSIEQRAARMGHYPEGRSENKGTEPEGIEFGDYGRNDQFLFVGSERSNLVFVYALPPGPIGAAFPQLVQVLPTGIGPEGLLAIPARDLFVVACEEDSREDKFRSTVMIYQRSDAANYPTVVSASRDGGAPIPWGALSGLAADSDDADTVLAIYDSFYRKSRIFTVDISAAPAVITGELALLDTNDVLLDALEALEDALPETATADYDPTGFIEDDGTVSLDPEGVALGGDGTYWIASEGAGNLADGVSDPDDRPFESPNLILNVAADGTILSAITLPVSLVENQLRFGFEGVAVLGTDVHVAFQRAWQGAGDPPDSARIGRYDTLTGEWTFVYYPLDAPMSPNGGWVGLSELTHLGGDSFVVIERDDQGGPDAAIMRLYAFDAGGVTFLPDAQAGAFDVVTKTLVRDLLLEGDYDVTGGLVPEKIEGLAVLADGTTLIVNDNDGVEDNNGETQLLDLGDLFD